MKTGSYLWVGIDEARIQDVIASNLVISSRFFGIRQDFAAHYVKRK